MRFDRAYAVEMAIDAILTAYTQSNRVPEPPGVVLRSPSEAPGDLLGVSWAPWGAQGAQGTPEGLPKEATKSLKRVPKRTLKQYKRQHSNNNRHKNTSSKTARLPAFCDLGTYTIRFSSIQLDRAYAVKMAKMVISIAQARSR